MIHVSLVPHEFDKVSGSLGSPWGEENTRGSVKFSMNPTQYRTRVSSLNSTGRGEEVSRLS